MPREFDAGRPIYTQLCQLLTQSIVSGELTPGQRLPGVREMALQYGVNPNTVQRTMAELERQGLVYSERTAGRFVTTDAALIAQVQREAALELAENFLEEMKMLGIQWNQARELLEQAAAGNQEGEHNE